jgi:hypothetical protein
MGDTSIFKIDIPYSSILDFRRELSRNVDIQKKYRFNDIELLKHFSTDSIASHVRKSSIAISNIEPTIAQLNFAQTQKHAAVGTAATRAAARGELYSTLLHLPPLKLHCVSEDAGI